MDLNANELKIWRKLDQYSRFHNRREIQDLSEEEIKKALAGAQLADMGRAGAYIAGEELLKEFEKSKEKDEKKKKTYRGIMIGAAGVCLAFLVYLLIRFFFFL